MSFKITDTKLVVSPRDDGRNPLKQFESKTKDLRRTKFPIVVGIDPERPSEDNSISLTKPREHKTYCQLHTSISGTKGIEQVHPRENLDAELDTELAKSHIATCCGINEGAAVGKSVGFGVGIEEGRAEGRADGTPLGSEDGALVGIEEGKEEGRDDGSELG